MWYGRVTVGEFGLIIDHVPSVDDISSEFNKVILSSLAGGTYLERGAATYGKFPDFCIIHANDFRFLSRPESKPRNEVDEEEDDACATKRISKARDGIGELIAELYPMTSEPTSVDDSKAVQVRNIVTV